jgi:hypothetical protein
MSPELMFLARARFFGEKFALGSPQKTIPMSWTQRIPSFGLRDGRWRIHNPASMPATMRTGICAFAGQLGFMVP